jgi:hypothetical protein
VESGHCAWVRASKGKYLSIGLDRGRCPPEQIHARWFHVTFLGKSYRENMDG